MQLFLRGVSQYMDMESGEYSHQVELILPDGTAITAAVDEEDVQALVRARAGVAQPQPREARSQPRQEVHPPRDRVPVPEEAEVFGGDYNPVEHSPDSLQQAASPAPPPVANHRRDILMEGFTAAPAPRPRAVVQMDDMGNPVVQGVAFAVYEDDDEEDEDDASQA